MSRDATRSRTIAAHSVLAALREEARSERHFIDDDEPRIPCPMDSAQSRRAAVLEAVK